jgi:hypothetical protein
MGIFDNLFGKKDKPSIKDTIKNKMDDPKAHIHKMLDKGSHDSLHGAKEIMAIAIIYENPRGVAPYEKHMLANMLVEQYKRFGWIPSNLSVDPHTPVAARELIYGKEISENACIPNSKFRELLAEMLADLIGTKNVKDTSAITFSGESVALGLTFFAVLAK